MDSHRNLKYFFSKNSFFSTLPFIFLLFFPQNCGGGPVKKTINFYHFFLEKKFYNIKLLAQQNIVRIHFLFLL